MPMILYIALGGAAGATARYGVAVWTQSWATPSFPWATPSFPWATFLVNISGSFLLGFAVGASEVWPLSPELRAGLTVGVLGAFTTFSTYSYEVVGLLREGLWGRAAVYALGSLILGILFAVAGYAVAPGGASPFSS